MSLAQPAAVASLEERRKPKTHRWTRWSDKLPKRVDLSTKAIAVTAYLVKRADNETGHCRVSVKTLMVGTGLSRSSVQRALGELEAAGAIRREVGGGLRGASHFWLLDAVDDSDAGVTGTRGEASQGRGGASEGRGGRVTETPLTTSGTTKELQPTHPPLTISTTTPLSASASASAASRRSSAEEEAGKAVVVVDEQGSDQVPLRPAGDRLCDSERWLVDIDQWAIAQGLPDEHLQLVRRAVLIRRTDRASIVAFLEQSTDWRDSPGSVDAELTARSGQLTFGGEGW
jgi:hypothetical protein